MSITITVSQSGATDERQVDTATTGLDLFGEDRSIVAMKVNGGETRDLARELTEGDRIEPVLITSPEGLAILRHSTAHVSAQAVQNLHAEAKLGIGPPITDGFYYDFQLAEPFTPESLKAIQKQMVRIIKEKQTFVRRVVDDETAKQELADEPFKLELVDLKGDSSADDGSAMEVGAGELTIYDNVRRNGETAWFDLCRGPHVPHTGTSTPPRSRSPAAPRRTGGGATRPMPSCSGSTAPRGRPRRTCRPISIGWRRPPSATTASSAPSWICSPSPPRRSARVCRSSTPPRAR